jgi:hypothetical protein
VRSRRCLRSTDPSRWRSASSGLYLVPMLVLAALVACQRVPWRRVFAALAEVVLTFWVAPLHCYADRPTGFLEWNIALNPQP